MKLIIGLMLVACIFLLTADFITINSIKAGKAIELNPYEARLFARFGYTYQPLILISFLGIGCLIIGLIYRVAEQHNAKYMKALMIFIVILVMVLFFFDMVNDIAVSIKGTGLLWLREFTSTAFTEYNSSR